MIRLKKILVPTDFSATSKEALKYAISLATEYGAEMTIMHVINEQLFTESLNLPRVMSLQSLEKELAKEAEHQMEDFFKDVLGMDDIDYKKIVLKGKPFIQIIQYSRENDIDLIVIGTHGRSGLEHIIFGSTAEKVVRKAPCPVLSVKPAQREFVMP